MDVSPTITIAQALFDSSGSGQGVDDMLEAIAHAQAEAVISALRSAGFTILHDSENHGPTLERAADVAENLGGTWTGSRDAFSCAQEAAVDDKCEEIAAAIRAMGEKK